LVERWLERSPLGLAGYDAASEHLLADREALARAWEASNDPFAMLLVLHAVRPGDESARAEELTSALVFAPAFARLARAQAKSPPGSNYNGPALFRFVRLAMTARAAAREAEGPLRAALELRLCAVVRAYAPDPLALRVSDR